MAERMLELTMINAFTIWSGIDIPFADTGYSIHQPRMIEIAEIGEEDFFQFVNLFSISKDNFTKSEEIADEELFLYMYHSVVQGEDKEMEAKAVKFLLLLFPSFTVGVFHEYNIFLIIDPDDFSKGFLTINHINFPALRDIVRQIFFLGETTLEEEYNPSNEQARTIAEKLKRGKKIASSQNGSSEEDKNFLLRYCSVLSVGLKLDMNIVLNYTFPQLRDTINRYHLHQNFDIGVLFKTVGSKEELENWEKRLI